MKPIISIITPTFNHEKFIGISISSVINQTYKNWEMIIVDDHSTDSTSSIITHYAKKDKRIKPIVHKQNWGISKLVNTYNQALGKTSGQIIAILEGDDFWPKNKLEEQIKVFRNKNVVLSYGNWAMTNREGKIVYIRQYDKFNTLLLNNTPPPSILNNFLTLKFDIGSQTVMIRKQALLQIGGFKNDKYYPFIDIPTYLHLSLQGNFAYIPKLLGYYRRTEQSSWINFAIQSKTMGREEMRNCINNFIKTKACAFSKTLDWSNIYKAQNQYLIKRKVLRFASILFNKFLAI